MATDAGSPLTRFRRSLAASTVSRTTADLATNLTAAEVRGVHVRVGQTVAHDFQAVSRSPTAMPWLTGPVTFAAVIVPVIVPEVVAGQAGWPPPPHRNIITLPLTLRHSEVQVSHSKRR